MTIPPTGPRRQPVWSGAITTRLARVIPVQHRDAALSGIKAIHTAIFLSVAGAIAVAMADGLREHPRRRTAIAASTVIAESILYVSNNQVCPLTPLAEQLGAAQGSVVDMYLPPWAARQIPLVGGSAAFVALVLNARALRRRPHIGA